MRPTTAVSSSHSCDATTTPLDWAELGAQIRAVAGQLASIHAATFSSQDCRIAGDHDSDVDLARRGEQSE